MAEHIVIIGASHAGISCAEQLRSSGFSGAITLVDRQSGAPLERPPLSKSYLGSMPEDDDKFLDSMNFIESLDVSYLHVFTYSERDNTHAITLPKIVNPNTRSKRSKLLRLLSSRKKSDFYKNNIGTKHNVLFESENKNGYIEGFSENYLRFRTIWDPKLAGTIKQMKFSEIDPEGFAI